jgi:hypothetical protein
VEFFDLLYLGIYAILSPAFDSRFYYGIKVPPCHTKEVDHALMHFHSLLHIFSCRFIVVLGGEVVSHSYVVDRMLGEFAAASVLLAKGVFEQNGVESDGEVDYGFASSAFARRIEDILTISHPDVLPYYSRCLDDGHKDFLWTGPPVQILPRSDAFVSLISLTTTGEMQDLPSHRIYTEDLDPIPTIQSEATVVGKRRIREGSPNMEVQEPKKRSRRS